MLHRLFLFGLLLCVVSLPLGAGEVIFSDGFESGDTCAWSSSVPLLPCAGSEITVNLPGDVPLVMVYIPPGSFMMGSPLDERGRDGTSPDEDLHQVTLTRGYYIGKYEVTQAQWEAVMGRPPLEGCGTSYGVGDDYPVYCVSWTYDITGAEGFLEKLNAHLVSTAQPGAGLFRLPSDAEWERAARAGTQTRFSFGDVLECGDECEACSIHDQYMWWCGNQSGHTEPVGSKLGNSYGLHDMHGNISEWVQDWYTQSLGTNPQTDPTGPASGIYRVVRGGSWLNYAWGCRSADRHFYPPGFNGNLFGFRVARTN